MAWSGDFHELKAFLRDFANIDGDLVPYDFGGVLLLWVALLDNLQANHNDADLSDVAGYLSPEQAEFLIRRAERVRNSPDVTE